jgi:hypothetical protein
MSYKGTLFFGINKEVSVKDFVFYRYLTIENKAFSDLWEILRNGI